MDKLIDFSDVIALVNVTKIESNKSIDVIYSNETRKEIVNDTVLNIIEIYKGNFEKSSNIIYRMNNSITQDEKINLNETMIVFLKKREESDTYRLAFGAQGIFKYNNETKQYKNGMVPLITFTDMLNEIEKFNAKPIEERDVLPKNTSNDNNI